MNHSDHQITTVSQVMALGNIKEHPRLGCVSPDEKFYFHNIPKNASSFMTGMLESFGWHSLTSHHQVPRHIQGSRGICLLRDPVKRWVSGITEFLSQIYDERNIDLTMDILAPLLQRNPDMDAHTAPQVSFLVGYDLAWFDFGLIHEIKGINSMMVNYLSLRGWNGDFSKYERENTTQGNQFKMKIRDLVKQKLKSDDRFAENIRKYYSADYELIDWVGRNNKWIPSI